MRKAPAICSSCRWGCASFDSGHGTFKLFSALALFAPVPGSAGGGIVAVVVVVVDMLGYAYRFPATLARLNRIPISRRLVINRVTAAKSTIAHVAFNRWWLSTPSAEAGLTLKSYKVARVPPNHPLTSRFAVSRLQLRTAATALGVGC